MLGRFIAVIVMFAVFGTAAGDDSDVKAEQWDVLANRWDLFRLCPQEEQMGMIVQGLAEHTKRAGLTEAQIRNAVESRLRGARIYKEDARPYVNVKFYAAEPATGGQYFELYGISLEYNRLLIALHLNLAYPVPTWSTGTIGKGDVASVLGNLSRLVDEFLAEYLRVRDSEACQEFRRQPAQFDRLKSLN